MGILDDLKKTFQNAVQQPVKQPAQQTQQRKLNVSTEQPKQPAAQMTALSNAINKWASQGKVVKETSARKKLFYEPEPQKNWYSGEVPTGSEILARIYTIGQTDQKQSQQLFDMYQTFANDPSSYLYNPYKQSTNKALTELQNLGIDTSKGIDDKWIQDNSWLMNYYRTETGNTPLSPSSKSTAEQNAAYWYYKVLSAEETTQKAETEWQALQDEIKYWAGRSDRNYSDDEILAKIDWSNYKTLTGMDENAAKGVPTVLNRPVGYSTDALKGVIWAARNGSTGDTTLDSVNAVLGRGKGWVQKNSITEKLDPTSKKYSPYSVGSTIDDAALYFGVQQFDNKWLENNRDKISSSDLTEQKMYTKVYNAEKNTQKAETELAELNKYIDAQIKAGVTDPDKLLPMIANHVENDCPTLAKMDESLKSGDLMSMTRAVNYKLEDIQNETRMRCAKETNKILSGELVQNLAKKFNTNIKAFQTDTQVQKWRDAFVKGAADTILRLGTKEEKIAFANAGSANYPAFVQDIITTLQSEMANGQEIIDDAKLGADSFVKDNYFDAYGVVSQYEQAQQQYNEAMRKINELTYGFEYIGNIDIYNRIPVVNPDGSYSTVDSFSVNIDGKEVLLPTIVDGKRVSEDEAIDHYFKTGEHLGMFDTPEEADEYAQKLHEQQAEYYSNPLDDFRANNPLPGYVMAAGGGSDAGLGTPQKLEDSGYNAWRAENKDTIDGLVAQMIKAGTSPEEAEEIIHNQYLDLMGEDVEEESEIDAELNYWKAEAENAQARMQELQAQYEEKAAIIKEAQGNYEALERLAAKYGIDVSDADQLMRDLETAFQLGFDPPQNEWNAYSVYDLAEEAEIQRLMDENGMKRDEAEAASKEYHDDLVQKTREGRAECIEFLAQFDGLFERLGITNKDDSMNVLDHEQLIPDEFVDNINKYREYLDRQVDGATYWLMPEEDWFDSAVQSQLDKVGDGSNLSWWGLTPIESYIQLAALSIKYPSMNISALANSVMGDEAMAINVMTTREKETLLAINENYGIDAAQRYLDFMNDPTYGMLITRESENKRQEIAEWTSKSGWAAAGMNLIDIIASPTRLLGTAYAYISGLSGNDINPNSKYFAASTLDSTVMTTTKGMINDKYGKDSATAWLMNLGYDSAKSILESMYTGHLFGGIGSGVKNVIGSNWISALPMGAEAVASAVQEAVFNGASVDQALAIGGVTMFAETVSEAITIGNLQEAFGKAANGGSEAFIKALLKDAIFEEAPGEMFNEALETAADYWIMGDKSNYEQEVQRLMHEEGLTRTEAEKLALIGVVGDVLYAGLSGAIGGLMGGGMESLAGKHAYNSAVRAYQKGLNEKLGINVDFEQAKTMFDAMMKAKAEQTGEQTPAEAIEEKAKPKPEIPQQAVVEEGEAVQTSAETTEAKPKPALPQQAIADDGSVATATNEEVTEAPATEEKPAPEIRPVDNSRFGTAGGSNSRAVNNAAALMTALSADTAGKTATLSASLAVDGQSAAPAMTAAQHLAETFGPDGALKVVHDIMLTTADNNLNLESVQTAVTMAILNEGGQAHTMLADMRQNGVTVEGLNDLVQEATAEMNDPAVMADVEATVRENNIAEHVKALVADGALNGLEPMKQSVTDAKNKRRAAKSALTKQVNKLKASQQAFQDAQTKFREDPSNKELKSAKRTASEQMKAQSAVVDEYRQRLQNAEEVVKGAEETLENAETQAMNNLRQQAQEQIAQEQEQAQVAAEQQAQAEAEAQVQAEEQRQDRNAQQLDVDAFIAEAFPNATEEEKQTIRDRIAEREQEITDPEKIRKRERFVKNLGKKFGVNINITDTTEGGTKSRYRGSYDEKTNTITIDKAASQSDAIYAVALHELTHLAERSGLYDQLASALTRIAYRNADGTFNEAQLATDIRARQQLYNARLADMNGQQLTTEQASKEVVADLTQRILFGDEAAINALVAEDESVARRMLNGIKNFLNKMRGINDPAITQLQQTRRLFEKALKEAQKNLGNTGNGQVQYSLEQREGTPVAKDSDGDTLVSKFDGETFSKQYSFASWSEQERATVKENLIAKGFSEEEVDKWIKNVDGVAAEIAKDPDRLDYEADPTQTFMKPNAEYKVTIDASTLCAKRLLYQGTFNAIQRLIPNSPIKPGDLIQLVNMMKDAGYVTPCSICYVESRRRNLGTYAKQFLDSYEGENKPTLAQLTTTDGLSELRESNPEAYEAFIKAMNRKGTSNPKVVQLRTDYRGDLRNLTKATIEYINRIGGLRFQSFSDFETPHLIDLMQAVMDGASMGLTAQAYTKVPAFAWVFGGTGIKINLSLIGEGTGLDANGNLIFSDVEGINHEEAFEIRNNYSDNVGTILVGMNDAHILAAMADDRIDFIIPFHRSGWSKADRAKMKALGEYFDYTQFQNERRFIRNADGTFAKTKNGKYKTERVAEGNLYPADYWDSTKSGKENAEIYLQKCAENGLLPKFSRFLVDNGNGRFSLQPDGSTDGYWKLLIDYKMYNNEGQFAPQEAMQPNFNMDKAMETLADYKGSADKLPVASDIVDQFVDWYKGEHPSKQYSLPSQNILDEQIDQFLSGNYEAFGKPKGTNQNDIQAFRGQRTVPEVQGTVPEGTPKVSPYQSAIKLADALGIGHQFGTSKMQNHGSKYPGKPIPKAVLGYFQRRAEYINVRSKEAGNYLTTMHELWHSLGKRLNMTGTADMVSKLDPVFAANYDPAELPGEAFAEFGWNYVMGDAQARAFAGDAFVDTFEREAKNSGLYKDIKQAQKEMQIWLNSDITAKERATVHNANEANKKNTGIRHLLDTIVDDTSAAEDVDTFTRKVTGKENLSADQSLRKLSLMKNFSSKVASALLTNKLTDSYGNEIGDSLAKRLEDAGVTGKDFDTFVQYWLFKHSIDRDAQGKPVFDEHSFPAAERQAFIDDIEANHKNIVDGVKALQDFHNDFMRAWLVNPGFLKETDLIAMQSLYPYYAPTMRIMDQNGGGFRGNRKGYTIRKATGGTQDIINPMDSYVSMIQSIVNMVRANKAAVLFDDLFLANEGMGQFAIDVTEDMRKETFNTEAIQEKVANIIYGKEQTALTEDQDDILQRVLNAIGSEQEQWRGTGKVNGSNILQVTRYGGEKVFYKILNPELYNLLASQRDNVASPLLQKVAKLTRAMSALTTGSNPVFALRNFLRDYQNSVNYGSWASNYLTGFPKWIKAAYDVWTNGGEYSDYVAQGGGGWNRIDTGTKAGITEYRGDLFKGYNTKDAAGIAKTAAKGLWSLVTFEKLNEVVEQASRYAEYKYGKHDKSNWQGRADAFLAAQEATVDFARTGNGRLAADLKAIIPFFGASMQGVYRTARMLTEAERGRAPARFTKAVINTALTSALCSALLLKFTPGDDEEEKKDFLQRFSMMSDDLKAGHFYLPNFAPSVFGDAPLIRIPVAQDPLMYAVHGAITNAIWSGSSDEMVVDLKSIANTILDNLTPINSTILDPLISLQTNKNWYGGSIVPSRMSDWEPTTQYTAETPSLFVNLGRAFGVSPMKLQYMAEQYTGFLGQMAIPAMSYDKNTGELGGLMAAVNAARKRLTSDPLVSNDIVSSFYDGANIMEQLKKAATNEMPTNMLRRGLSDEELTQALEEAQAMTSKGGIVYDTKQLIKDTYAKIDKINANDTLTDEEKYKLTSEARKEMLDAVLDAQEAIGAWKEAYVTGRNFVTDALYPGGVTHNPTAYEKMPDTFKADENKEYMQMATELYEKTGNSSALPHPNYSFSDKKTPYEVTDEYKAQFDEIYKEAYEKYFNDYFAINGADWGRMTDEERLEVMKSAHTKGSNAAKAWYVKEMAK